MVGDGFCISRCYAMGVPCAITRYYKRSSDYDECKSTCKNEPACSGFALSDNTFKFPNYCFVYGNISSIMVANWANPGAWKGIHKSSYGFKDFKVQLSDGKSGVQCFKRLDNESHNNGEFNIVFNYITSHILCNYQNITIKIECCFLNSS